MDLYKILKETGLPVAYYKFEEEVSPPFLAYYGSGSKNLGADNGVYHKDYDYTIEYYYTKKDFGKEELIESKLDEHELYWSKSTDIYIDQENMFVIYYYI